MPSPTDPEIAVPTSGARRRPDPIARARPRLLRSALAAGRLPLGSLRLTILQALDVELRRGGHTPRERRTHRDRVGRFLADHADRRRVPPLPEVRRWARELTRRGRADAAEAEALLRSVRLLYTAVLERRGEEGAREEDGGPGGRRASSGPVTGRRRPDRAARQ